ncbi:MAG: site-specific integrase [Gammaproteobacteria bacterium]
MEAYFAIEVTTAASSQAVQRRDIGRFLAFVLREEGTDRREVWTPRLSRAFVEDLRRQLQPEGGRVYSDRTINRMVAHLKTFAKWIHSRRPFKEREHPMEKLKTQALGAGLETERAVTPAERRKLLDAADCLPVIGGRSRNRRLTTELPDERPRRKSYRPWRNRAIIYLLIETGMRRAAVTRLNFVDIDAARQAVSVPEKGGLTHRYQISRQGLKAIADYLEHERTPDADYWDASDALFLPASCKPQSLGRLNPVNINAIWNETCALARVKGRTPHSARHAMGRHIMEKTGNVAAVQRQLGHKNAAYALQYARITEKELNATLDDRE